MAGAGAGSARGMFFSRNPTQVVRSSHRLSHGVRIPPSGDDRVTGHQRGFGEINAHATASSSNKPSLLVTHDIFLVLLFKTLL